MIIGYFTDMSARERAIDGPCSHTFGWIFDERVTERERHDGRLTFFDVKVIESKHYDDKEIRNLMSRWLEHEHGIFFIVGKAGSGKSTLMRFLAGHKKTSTLLERWARRQDCDLRVCAHYFWCSGSQLQSSQEGLWRSILYTIAKADRRLASAMFAERARDDGQTPAHLRTQPWARNDLIRALSLLVGQLEVQKVAICLFIDGLDEYQGDEMMLIAELRQLLVSPYIKICASSRPRNLLEQAFGHKDHQWKLALHLLTHGDMVQLAHTRLYEDETFCKFVDREDRRQEFATTIADRSQGVFLWTVLVVRDMIREAHQGGTIVELKERLKALPIELGGEKGMYQRVVERSDPHYRKYMARLLLVMLDSLEARDRKILWGDVHFLYEDARDSAFATRECLGLDDKYRLAWDKKPGEDETSLWYQIRALEFTSCRGVFLACHQGRSGAHPHGVNCQVDEFNLIEDTIRQVRKWCPDFVDSNANTEGPCFLHRSVGEYLSLPEIRERMADLAGLGYDSVSTNCRLRLAYSRLHSCGLEDSFMRKIASVGYKWRDFVRAILPEFERIQDTKRNSVPVRENHRHFLDNSWATSFEWPFFSGMARMALHGLDISRNSQNHAWFLSFVAREGCVWYCREHYFQVPTSCRQATGTIIIAGLLLQDETGERSRDQADLVQYLLCSGVNPNQKYTWVNPWNEPARRHLTASLWEAYVEVFPYVWEERIGPIVPWALEVMQLLLRYGRADKQCRLPPGRKSLLSALIFEPDFDTQNWILFAGRLHKMLDAHGLLTRRERHVARELGLLSSLDQAQGSAFYSTEPDARPFGQ